MNRRREPTPGELAPELGTDTDALEALDLPLGVVLGTFGVERHQITFRGQAAHAGSTPMDKRRDALAAFFRPEVSGRPFGQVRQVGADGRGRRTAQQLFGPGQRERTAAHQPKNAAPSPIASPGC